MSTIDPTKLVFFDRSTGYPPSQENIPPKGPSNNSFLPQYKIGNFNNDLAPSPIGKSFQVACGQTITTVFFKSLGILPTSFHPDALNKKSKMGLETNIRF
jgi:hypothetical protein